MHSSATKPAVPLTSIPSSHAPNGEDPAWRAWMARFDRPTASLLEAGVEAGRIGSRPSQTAAQRARLASQEIAVFGRVVTPQLMEA